jgi:signal transduction histidine kinase
MKPETGCEAGHSALQSPISYPAAMELDSLPPPVPEASPSQPTSNNQVSIATSFFRSGFMVLGCYLMTMLLVSISAWALITQDWIRQQRIQEVELSSLARAQDEHVSHIFSKAEESLHIMADLMTFSAGPSQHLTHELSDEALEGMANTPQLRQFAFFSGTGKLILDLRQNRNETLPALPAQAMTFWNRNEDAQIYVHPPISDTQRNWFIPIEWAVRKPGTKWMGSLFVMVATREFNNFFRETQLTTQDQFSLFTLEGALLLHFPSEHREAAPTFASLRERLNKIPQAASGNFDCTYRFSDSHQTGMFRRLHGLPLIVAVTRPTHVAHAAFLAMKQRLLTGVWALALLLAAVCWLIYSDSRRHETARTALRRLNTSLEERVRRRTSELEQSNRELIAFSYSISHDLRAPLRAINGFAHALKEDYGGKFDALGSDYLDRVYRASVRMGELIDELLSLANVSRAPLNIRDVDVCTMANDLIEDLRINGPGRKVDFYAQPNMHAEGDEALLRNALSNLLHNAWKFTRARDPAVITLTSEEEGEFMRFSLNDNGIGFDMAHAKRLFQPFQQLHGDQGFGGTGIGLASVRRIIERHGGFIWAESAPDEGARFIFMLPIRAKVIRRRRE